MDRKRRGIHIFIATSDIHLKHKLDENDLGMAVAKSLAAVQNGARQVACCMRAAWWEMPAAGVRVSSGRS